MKKFLKSKIFTIIICGIIFTSLGVYADSIFLASNIWYDKNENDLTVEDALNELYEKVICKTLCRESRIVKVGDYIKMTPTSTSYTISKDLTGYDSNQTINPSELNLWRVIKINENGTIEMISENVSSTNVYFKGQTGYLNFVGTLNEIASQYENSKYVVGSRIMGYVGQTEYITDTSKFTTTAPWTSSTKDNTNEKLGGGDIMYEADTNLVNEVLGTLIATNPSGTATDYWLGSRYYEHRGPESIRSEKDRLCSAQHEAYVLHGRYIGGYHIWNDNMSQYDKTWDIENYGASSICSSSDFPMGWASFAKSNAIRPILTLKSGLIAPGSGTSEDPWVLE